MLSIFSLERGNPGTADMAPIRTEFAAIALPASIAMLTASIAISLDTPLSFTAFIISSTAGYSSRPEETVTGTTGTVFVMT